MHPAMAIVAAQNGAGCSIPIYKRDKSTSNNNIHILKLPIICRLRRIYITFNAKHSVNRLDEEMLSHLSRTLFQGLSSSWALSMENGNPRLPRITQIQPVITKADYLSEDAQAVVDRLLDDVHNTVKRSLDDTGTGTLGIPSDELAKLMCLPPMLTSVRMNPPFGIEKIRKNIVDACNSPV